VPLMYSVARPPCRLEEPGRRERLDLQHVCIRCPQWAGCFTETGDGLRRRMKFGGIQYRRCPGRPRSLSGQSFVLPPGPESARMSKMGCCTQVRLGRDVAMMVPPLFAPVRSEVICLPLGHAVVRRVRDGRLSGSRPEPDHAVRSDTGVDWDGGPGTGTTADAAAIRNRVRTRAVARRPVKGAAPSGENCWMAPRLVLLNKPKYPKPSPR
jgi:hypothetical protein